jgi:dGTPase
VQAQRDAVTYVAGMTDRFAFAQARAHLGWDPSGLPAGLDTGR